MNMLGATKVGTTKRYVAGAYVPHLEKMNFRFEPIVSKNLAAEFKFAVQHVSYRFFSDVVDIKFSDRIAWEGREFVIIGKSEYNDDLGRHLEYNAREVATNIHKDIILKRLTTAHQVETDPLFREYVPGTKVYGEETIKALVDTVDLLKRHFIENIDSGKMENIDRAMIIDLPTIPDITDRYVMDGIEYEVEWITPMLGYYIVGLKKSKINYKM